MMTTALTLRRRRPRFCGHGRSLMSPVPPDLRHLPSTFRGELVPVVHSTAERNDPWPRQWPKAKIGVPAPPASPARMRRLLLRHPGNRIIDRRAGPGERARGFSAALALRSPKLVSIRTIDWAARGARPRVRGAARPPRGDQGIVAGIRASRSSTCRPFRLADTAAYALVRPRASRPS